MDTLILAEIIRQLPAILLIALVGTAGYRYRCQIGAYLASRTHVKVAAAGFALEVDGEVLQREVEAARPTRAIATDAGDRIVARAQRIGPVLNRASILWVDDEPESTLAERRIFHQLGLFVNPVVDTDRALRALRTGVAGFPYDLVISDIKRVGAPRAGQEMLQRVREAGDRVPLVFYVGTARRDTPPGAFGITDRPDELLGLVLDVLERRPGSLKPMARGHA